MKVIARDQDTGRQRVVNVEIADENALDLPTGTSSLALVGAGAVAQAASTILGGGRPRARPARCARASSVRERKEPLRFCNRYVDRGGAGERGRRRSASAAPMVTDFVEAVTQLDEFNFATLHVTGVEVNLKVRRGLRQAFLLEAPRAATSCGAGAPRACACAIQEVRGEPRLAHDPRARPARHARAASATSSLEGAPADDGGELEIDLSRAALRRARRARTPSDRRGRPAHGRGARRGRSSGSAATTASRRASRRRATRTSLDELGEDADGPEGVAREEREVFRDPELRLSGTRPDPGRRSSR